MGSIVISPLILLRVTSIDDCLSYHVRQGQSDLLIMKESLSDNPSSGAVKLQVRLQVDDGII